MKNLIQKLMNKKVFIPLIAILLILIISLGTYFFLGKEKISNYFESFIPKTPIVIGGNFDLNYKKIPFNSEYIDFTFSEDLDKNTIINDNVSISPKLEGNLTLINSNTIRYIFTNNISVGDNYIFTFNENIKGINGKKINEVNFDLNVVSNAKVVKITPEGELNNLNQNFAVFFNIPVVPLTDLDNRDKLPCPISFEPKVEGTCKWTTTSVLEFVPTNRLFGATDYKVKVENKEGLLYKLDEIKEIEVKTPNLSYNISDEFSVKDGININFNFAVNIEELKSKLFLYNDKTNLEYIISSNGDSETSYNIRLKEGNFNYNTDYRVEIKYGLESKNGNRIYNSKIVSKMKSFDFLKYILVYRDVYSSTGVLIDTKSYYTPMNKDTSNGDYDLPIKDLFFQLDFEEEVSLDNKNYKITDESGNILSYKSEYITEQRYNEITKEREEFINKKRVELTLDKSLENNKKYLLTISKDINNFLINDIVKKYKTSNKFVIKDLKFLSYNKSCLYLSNSIENFWSKKDDIIETFPESRISSIFAYEWIPYNLQDLDEESLAKEGYCREAKDGEYLYVLNTRLNPNTEYEIKIKDIVVDKFGNKLEDGLTKAITTGDIYDKDKYLYSGVSRELNVIPSNLPIVVNLQTINLDNIELEVCEMDEYGYIDYQNRRWDVLDDKSIYEPNCINKKRVNLEVKNNYWNLTNNKFDLEDDILGTKFKNNFVLVRGYKRGDIKSFENTYIRTGLSIAYEVADNKKLLFITDFNGNSIDGNIDFTNLNFDYKTKKIITKKIDYSINDETKVFEGKDYLSRYLIVRNGDKLGFLDINQDAFSNYDFKYISGETTSEKNYLYLYTERPIYKPGDTVYIKGLLRKFDPTGYTITDIKTAKIEVIDSNKKTISSIDIEVDDNSNFSGEFIIPEEVSLGKFSFRFQRTDGEAAYTVKNNASFYIEEYVKPTFKISIDEGEKDYILGNNLKLNILPEYYFGGKIINTTGDYSLLIQNYFFDAKDFSDYQFGEGYRYFDCIYWGYCNFDDKLITHSKFDIDENGEYVFNYNFVGDDLEAEKLYNFNFDVKDPDTSKTVSKTVTKVLHSTDAYVGLKVDYYNSKESGIDVNGVILDFDAKILAGKNAKIELIKREWKSVKKKGVDGIFYNDYSLKETLESSYETSSDTKGLFRKNIKPKTSGEYEVRVIYSGSNNGEFVSSRNVYVAGDEYIEWHNDNNDVTELVAEKVQVKVGETAQYMLKSPINTGKALIVIEKDNAIIDYFIHDIKTYSDNIDIKIKNTYYPNFYLKAFLIGSQENNPLPIYKRALTVTKVSTDYKKLNIDIKTDSEKYLPGDKVKLKIKVTDYIGDPVENSNISIGIVDESLLALKGNPKKNPYAFFYDLKRYLGTSSYGSLKNLIEKLEVKDITDGEKGGAGDQVKGGDSKKKRGEFKDTAFWSASVTTDKNGYVEIESTELPGNLTTWVIEALANTSYDTKIGVNYKTIITSKQLMINDNLPSFFGSSDKIILSPVVFNKTGINGEFNVSLNLTNSEIIGKKSQIVEIKNGESKTVNFEIKVNDIGISEDKYLFNSKINFKASSLDNKYVDEIEKFVQIKEVSTPEFVSTFGKTSDASFEEKIEVGDIKNNAGKLTINYSATLLNSIIDGVEYLSRYPYGYSEQQTSAIMPNIFIKKLYNSVGIDFDLTKKMVKYWVDDYEGYKEKSLDQIIKEYIVNIRKYQNIDGGFVYFYDKNEIYGPNYSKFDLTSYILESGALIKSIGYKLEESVYFDSIKYLKNRFYKNYIEGCKLNNYNDCKYSEVDRLKAINAILTFDDNDYEAYKMWKLLDLTNTYNSLELEKVKVIAKLLKINQITADEKLNLEKQAKEIIDTIISEELVFNPKGAYLGQSSYYSRFRNTVSLLEAVSTVGLEKFTDIESIIDNINRWIISQKEGGNFGSTQDNIAFIKAMTNYLESSGELKDINYFAKLKINSELVEEKGFDDKNKLEVYTKILKLDSLKDTNSFVINKEGNGTVYYDLNLSYYKDAKDIKPRDEGFYVEKNYYIYDNFKKIESLKNMEWIKYQNNEITYEKLKYPKSVYEYLTPVTSGKVGELLIVKNKVITTETRDKVAYEGFIPAGSELINPNLDTSSDKAKEFTNNYNFEKTEYRTDRYFAYSEYIYPGIHEFTYLIRLTHAGEYTVRPSRASEFYNVEVFGRSGGEVFKIVK